MSSTAYVSSARCYIGRCSHGRIMDCNDAGIIAVRSSSMPGKQPSRTVHCAEDGCRSTQELDGITPTLRGPKLNMS